MKTYKRSYGETHILSSFKTEAKRLGKTWEVKLKVGDTFRNIWDDQWYTVTGFIPLDNDIKVLIDDGHGFLSEISETKVRFPIWTVQESLND